MKDLAKDLGPFHDFRAWKQGVCVYGRFARSLAFALVEERISFAGAGRGHPRLTKIQDYEDLAWDMIEPYLANR